MKRLYASTSVEEAEQIQGLLRKAGIESRLDTKSGGSVQTGAVVFGIYIEDKDAGKAVEILAAWIEKDEAPEEDLPPE